ncbi:KpsF/GutQ family sugar-phosphate isomerase [Solitalea lacus]|uniref:KpsF/GutQ family sugar-phosphate isomerase n=1 Tax=Solitalea lacus TaxID=2911172 RepID=UPI001EDC3506|nr:KpsF/GutQ family sugar-phosphate isomerase [Solitalea lacus]UKJ05947.1 KpsF/GutQ family sugar-phosphate isomerase [Solitalea lacus]
MNKLQILDSAKKTLQIEADALLELQTYINNDFETIVNIILQSKGRVVITGIGKSAIIAQKIVATMNSTGTPALYMHAADAIHGDLGMIQQDDVTICISKSGNTPEIKVLVPLLKQSGNVLIGMAGDMKSYLATHSDYVLNTTVKEEACPHNLAPTTSTTAQLAMGDALAVCLLQQRNFTSQDFARYHPGGALGKKLYLKVKDLSVNNQKPQVNTTDDIKRVIFEISSKRLGSTAVVNNEELVGVITDGDLRRMMEKNENFSTLRAVDIMNSSPKTIDSSAMAVDALALMKQHNISQLIVVNNHKYAGVIHLHDLIKEGII